MFLENFLPRHILTHKHAHLGQPVPEEPLTCCVKAFNDKRDINNLKNDTSQKEITLAHGITPE